MRIKLYGDPTIGHSHYATRPSVQRILNDVGDDLAAVFPSTRAVDQPWFRDWLPPRTGTLAGAHAILKETWHGPTLHTINEEASPFWQATIRPAATHLASRLVDRAAVARLAPDPLAWMGHMTNEGSIRCNSRH